MFFYFPLDRDKPGDISSPPRSLSPSSVSVMSRASSAVQEGHDGVKVKLAWEEGKQEEEIQAPPSGGKLDDKRTR